MSIIGVAGSSGSGKTSLAVEIVHSLDLPWVIILSIDSFYKSLTPEQNKLAHANEYDLDSPGSIDFDLLVECLRGLKQGKKVEIPVYSFQEHQRLEKTVSIYSPHVVILEGILALNDPRVLDMCDIKVFVDADADLCLSRRIVRDVPRERQNDRGCDQAMVPICQTSIPEMCRASARGSRPHRTSWNAEQDGHHHDSESDKTNAEGKVNQAQLRTGEARSGC